MSSDPVPGPRARPAHPLAGPFLALLGFALYASHDALVKHLGATYSAFQILFFSALLSFPLVVAMLLRERAPGSLRPRHPGWSALRTLAMVLSWVGAFYAFGVLPLAETYAILFAMPLMITLIAIPVLGERVGRHRGIAVAIGLAGVMIVLRPGGAALSFGHLAALVGAASAALAAVIVRRIGRDERAAVLVLYPMLASVVLMGLVMPVVYVPVRLADLAVMAVVGVLSLAATLFIILAYRLAEATLVAPMQYSQILWAALFGWLFFAESPDLWTWAGAAVIIASGLYILFRESRRDVSAHRPALATPGRLAPLAGPEEPAPNPAGDDAGSPPDGAR